MEDPLAVISCIISNPDSVATVNEKFHLQSGLIIARLGVPCRDYGVSVISVVLHGTQNQISSFAGDLAMGLEFKMGSEILRTVVVREWKEIGIVAGIIALRAALTFLIHWEIKEEERAE